MNNPSLINENRWLNRFERSVTSSAGEDGILEKILEVIEEKNGWCVEFGASDGKDSSNTYNLIQTKNYSAVLIEPDPRRFKDLQANHAGNPKVTLLNCFVGFDGDNTLEKILAPLAVPPDPDVLSIDIDGNDYHVWNALNRYRPKVVIFEFNPTIPTGVEFVQAADPNTSHGCSLTSVYLLAKKKGYELVATTFTNAFFVDNQYFPLFKIKDNSVAAIRSDQSVVTHIFTGYDGTVFLTGYKRFYWHFIPFNEKRFQHIPIFFRQFPPRYGKLKTMLAGIYLALFRGGEFPKEFIQKGIKKLFR